MGFQAVTRPRSAKDQFTLVMFGVAEAANRVAIKHIRARQEYVRPWLNVGRDLMGGGLKGKSKPAFYQEARVQGAKATVQVFSESEHAEGTSVSVWSLLRDGTRSRAAILPDDYAVSTTPNSTASGPRNAVPTRLGPASSGIAERNMDKKFNEELQPYSEAQFDEGFKVGFSKAERGR